MWPLLGQLAGADGIARLDGSQSLAVVLFDQDSVELPGDNIDYCRALLVALGMVAWVHHCR